jgi:hypothetical protein
VSARSMVDPAWVAPPGTWVRPVDEWGFMEEIDGKLADQFEISIDEAGVDIGGGILGWNGSVATRGHKYSGLNLSMSPRHTDWLGVVVINVTEGEKLVFSGMADTSGLECNWL